MRRILLTAALLTAAWGAGAQERAWTLRDCIDYALEHNLSVQQQVISVQQSEIELNTAVSSRLPGVSATASENFSFGRGLTSDNTYSNTNTTSTSVSLGASVPVFQGFYIKHSIDAGRLSLQAATADLNKIKDDIRTAVAQAYVQILYDMELLDVAEARIAIDSLQLVRREEMLRSGLASPAEVAQQRATLAQSRYSRVQAANNLSLALLDLTQLLELHSPEGFSIVRPSDATLGVQALASPETIYAEAVDVRPAITAELRRLDAAGSRIGMARSARYPTLSLSGGLGSNYYTASSMHSASFYDQMKNNFSQYVGLSLNIPIFNRFSTRNAIRNASLGYEAQRLQVDAVHKSLYKEIQQAYYTALRAQERLLSAQEVLASAGESFELMKAKYENGKANLTEFNEAENTYLQARSDLAQARYEHLYASRLLYFYRGDPLDF